MFNNLLDQIKKGEFPPKCGLILTSKQWFKIVQYTSLYCQNHGYVNYLGYIESWSLGILDD